MGCLIDNLATAQNDSTRLVRRGRAKLVGLTSCVAVVAPLAGVVLGWVLAVGWQSWRDRRRVEGLNAALRAEAASLLAQIDQFREIARLTIEALGRHEILAGPHVPAITTFFERLFADIAPHLSPVERNLLHVVHGRLQVGDEVLSTYDVSLRNDLNLGIIDEPWSAYASRIRDLQESYDVCERLLRSYLEGEPIDPFPAQQG
jgi:hypothetical protein